MHTSTACPKETRLIVALDSPIPATLMPFRSLRSLDFRSYTFHRFRISIWRPSQGEYLKCNILIPKKIKVTIMATWYIEVKFHGTLKSKGESTGVAFCRLNASLPGKSQRQHITLFCRRMLQWNMTVFPKYLDYIKDRYLLAFRVTKLRGFGLGKSKFELKVNTNKANVLWFTGHCILPSWR